MQHYPSQEARALLTPQGIYGKFSDFGQIFLSFFFRILYLVVVVVFAFFPYIFFALAYVTEQCCGSGIIWSGSGSYFFGRSWSYPWQIEMYIMGVLKDFKPFLIKCVSYVRKDELEYFEKLYRFSCQKGQIRIRSSYFGSGCDLTKKFRIQIHNTGS